MSCENFCFVSSNVFEENVIKGSGRSNRAGSYENNFFGFMDYVSTYENNFFGFMDYVSKKYQARCAVFVKSLKTQSGLILFYA